MQIINTDHPGHFHLVSSANEGRRSMLHILLDSYQNGCFTCLVNTCDYTEITK
jgi:hypothetical protein